MIQKINYRLAQFPMCLLLELETIWLLHRYLIKFIDNRLTEGRGANGMHSKDRPDRRTTSRQPGRRTTSRQRAGRGWKEGGQKTTAPGNRPGAAGQKTIEYVYKITLLRCRGCHHGDGGHGVCRHGHGVHPHAFHLLRLRALQSFRHWEKGHACHKPHRCRSKP